MGKKPIGKGRTGRKPIIARQETLKEIKRLAELGMKDKDIANIIGVSKQTWDYALMRGNEDKASGKRSHYVVFINCLIRARSKGISSALQDLRTQSKAGNDRASRFLVELDPDYAPAASVPSTNNTTNQLILLMNESQLDRFLNGDRSVLEEVQNRLPG